MNRRGAIHLCTCGYDKAERTYFAMAADIIMVNTGKGESKSAVAKIAMDKMNYIFARCAEP